MPNKPDAIEYAAKLSEGIVLSPPGSGLTMAEWTADGCPPGSTPMRIAPLHLHREDDEAWYVLSGTIAVQIGDNVVLAPAGTAVIVPRGTPHTYWNPEPEEARYLIVMTPRIMGLIDSLHSLERRDPESVKHLFARFGMELLE